MNRKIVETAKNILIVLLLLSAVFLGWESRLFGNTTTSPKSLEGLLKGVSGGASGSSPDATKGDANTIRPVVIGLTDDTGKHYGVKYDLDEIKRLYAGTSTYFMRALGSVEAAQVQETDVATWRKDLQSLGIYYEYLAPVKLSVLEKWLGANNTGDLGGYAVRRLCLTDSGGGDFIAFQDDTTGKFYTAATGPHVGFTALPDTGGIDEAVFAFEKVGKNHAPYTLLLPGVTDHPRLGTSNPLNDEKTLDGVLMNLVVNPQLQTPYTEPDGTRVYVGSDFKLRLGTDGTILWTANDDTASGSALSESDAVAQAGLKVSETVGSLCGDAAVYFGACTEPAAGAYQVTFNYVAAGGLVWLHPDGYAAKITFKNGRIVDMELRFRRYSILTGQSDQIPLLPEMQTAAATNGDFMLGYDDNRTDQLTPSWVDLPLFSKSGETP